MNQYEADFEEMKVDLKRLNESPGLIAKSVLFVELAKKWKGKGYPQQDRLGVNK